MILVDKFILRDIFVRLSGVRGTPPQTLNFHKAVHVAEAELITSALRATNQSITHASRLLGFAHHQSLISLLDGRHSNLRIKPKLRRKSRPNTGRWNRDACCSSAPCEKHRKA